MKDYLFIYYLLRIYYQNKQICISNMFTYFLVEKTEPCPRTTLLIWGNNCGGNNTAAVVRGTRFDIVVQFSCLADAITIIEFEIAIQCKLVPVFCSLPIFGSLFARSERTERRTHGRTQDDTRRLLPAVKKIK